MGKLTSPLCKFRRRSRALVAQAGADAGEIVVDESEDEIKIDNFREDYGFPVKETVKGCVLKQSPRREEQRSEVESCPFAKEFQAPTHHQDEQEQEQVDDEQQEHGNWQEDEEEPQPQVEEEEEEQDEQQEDQDSKESLSTLLTRLSSESVNLDNIKSMSLTLNNISSDLSMLQSYCTSRIQDMILSSNLAEKCMDSLVPFCAPSQSTELRPVDKLLTLGNGCFSDSSAPMVLNNTELQVVDVTKEEELKDPPTLPSGIKFVDDLNKMLDCWSDYSSPDRVNIFKLFNISAILRYLGDPRCVEIINNLGRKDLLSLPDSDQKWSQILRDASADKNVTLHPLPELPNKNVVSNCNVKLVDLPVIDNRVDEHAFKLYWSYTNKWLTKMFGPSFRHTYKFLQPTKKWYLALERTSQVFFLRLSKTLCCTQ
ncbi:hypothetical protein BEWA_000230 [Theileria equi strain WA]|uniref:Uncharacterized protein n=1 Tax=Theileria equi strain WA TaxID=1537102 RepID=L0B0F5_THEEQ|nr:hypothetical protein BEWA_000230 [Theileria equi strain WA]AFZ80619.1 hypothetical protein BEWA_000230 [Theileria equi strain WA]|eukprot:XP_004830285.1 hypothetical protein BEWA_000230 [Theileria equi strain WA]